KLLSRSLANLCAPRSGAYGRRVLSLHKRAPERANRYMQWWWRRRVVAGVSAIVLAATLATGTAIAAGKMNRATFNMMVSPGAATCLPHANAEVRIRSIGPVEIMNVEVHGLPRNTDFDFFVIQTPNTPFGVSWYQGDIETNDEGEG